MNNTKSDDECSAACDCYPSYEMMHRFEQDARRKDVEMERLWELSRNDPTINTFFTAWRKGHFQSFEQMLVKLSVQLAMEKAEYLKTATKAIQLSPLSSVVIQSDG